MKNKAIKGILGASMLGLVAFLMPVAFTHAENDSIETTLTIKKNDRMPEIKAKADQAIAKRIDALNKVINHLNEMKKLSADSKASLTAKAQANIASLTTLRAKIAADTDLAVLKTDVATITKNYRIYMLVIPQIHLISAADRLSVAADETTVTASALQTRINAAQAAGKDVSAMNAKMVSMQGKISTARTSAQNAKAQVINLIPDNGSASVIASNKSALASAKSLSQSASTNLKGAREDGRSINKSLRALNF